jgi:hypothetical protein
MSDQTTEQTVTAPQLQLADLLACVQLIQLATQRGAYKAEEFTQIGAVYDRMVSFLKDSGAIQPAPTASEPAEQTAE